ncbi:ABC transporter substrate-binding protein [Alteribacter aurantiacus]|uniref:ABC transporter substrate-binding protein n=1 Tax=Alteribacter aurantiacus TaxID=254410 RepID=UPI0004270088|nr:extracellular solute-binding protein [Alteribacter aurantiacus]
MKKFLTGLSVVAMASVAIGCSDNDAGGNTEGSENTEGEPVALSFASWALGTEEELNLDRMMIDAFEEEYPHITVEIDESISPEDWNGSLSTAASASDMPDVFLLAQIPTGLSNDWLMNIEEFTSSDEDFQLVPEPVQESVTYDDSVYAIPSGQHFLGYFINEDLFEQGNLDVPQYGLPLDDFSSLVRDVTDVNGGVAGMNHPWSIVDWYPAAADSSLGWYTYSDEGYQLDSGAFIEGVNFAESLISNNLTYETLSEDQQANFNGEDPEQVWINGGVGFKWDGTWGITEMNQNLDYNWDFVGIPNGNPVLVNDYMGIAQSTEHPEEAYLFAKWMTFGKDGFMKRLEIAQEEGQIVNTMPLTSDQEVLDVYFEGFAVPGILEAYENIEDAIVEPVKTVPGYTDSRWEAPTGVSLNDEIPNATIANLLDAGIQGEIQIENYISQINDLANEKYEEGQETLNR